MGSNPEHNICVSSTPLVTKMTIKIGSLFVLKYVYSAETI